MSILIKNVLLDNEKKDILIEKNRIIEIGDAIPEETVDVVIDGNGKAAIPGLINVHAHSAMTLLRGYADDMVLQDWLEKKNWPLEAKMTEEDIYWGAKLACLEMIKTGTTTFNDMYWHMPGTVRAVEEMGLRAVVSSVFIDLFDKDKRREQIILTEELFKKSKEYGDRVIFSLGPHAIYTVSREALKWTKDFAVKNNLLIHIHVSETKKEVEDSVKNFGKRPFEYLDEIGFLGPDIIAAHAVWLNENEIKICAKHDVKLVYNPASNLKLASGNKFLYKEMSEEGLTVALGTDGCASSNNLDLLEAVKIASLLQKDNNNNPTELPITKAFEMITKNGAQALGIDVGEIKEGKLADIALINLNRPEFTPNHNFISNLIYSGSGHAVDTVICDGKILMKNGKVDGEEEIMEMAQKTAFDLVNR